MSSPSTIQKARMSIAAGNLPAAISLLDELADADQKNQLLLMHSTLNQLKRKELVTGRENSEERQSITWGLVQFIERMENQAVTDHSGDTKRLRLLGRIERAESLLDQWEEKRELAENPSEERRAAIEIKRLSALVEEYRTKLI